MLLMLDLILFKGDSDLLPEDIGLSQQGIKEDLESLMGCLGLSERRPIPDPVTFVEKDPLGKEALNVINDGQDIFNSLGIF